MFSTKEEQQKETSTEKEEVCDVAIMNESRGVSKYSNTQEFEDDACE